MRPIFPKKNYSLILRIFLHVASNATQAQPTHYTPKVTGENPTSPGRSCTHKKLHVKTCKRMKSDPLNWELQALV